MSEFPLAKATPEKLREIIREAEATLDAQLRIASAADARAMTFAGLMMASIAVVSNAVAAHPASINGIYIGMTVSCLTDGLCFYGAAKCPSNAVKLVGNRPAHWFEDVKSGDDFHEGLAAMAHYYDDMIVENDRRIAFAANMMRISIASAAAATVFGALNIAVLLPRPA